jgi:integrase
MACVRKRRGKYVLDFYDQSGERHWETVGTNKKEADELLAQRLIDIGKGRYITPKDRKIAFKEFAEKWLEGRGGKIRPSTIAQYDDHVRKHLLPFFGAVKVSEINVALVEAYSAKKQKDMVEIGRRKAELIQQANALVQETFARNDVAESRDALNRDARLHAARLRAELGALTRQEIGIVTINKTLTTLGTILKYAVRDHLLDSNPVTLMDRPKKRAQEYSGENEEMEIFTPEQIRALLAGSDDGLYRTLFTAAIMTGMREGELFGLQWGDIDWNSCQILVRRTLTRTKLGWKFFEPKTKKSRRRIDVDPTVLLDLKKWKLRLAKSEPEDLVFPSFSGEPLHRSTLYKQGYLPAIRRSGVPRIHFRNLRHTYASLLIAQGEQPKYIQDQMGHSSIKVTFDIYGHLMEKVNVRSANRLAMTVFGEDRGGTSSETVADSEKREAGTDKLLN